MSDFAILGFSCADFDPIDFVHVYRPIFIYFYLFIFFNLKINFEWINLVSILLFVLLTFKMSLENQEHLIHVAWNSIIIVEYVTKTLYKMYGVKRSARNTQVKNHKMVSFRTKSVLCQN